MSREPITLRVITSRSRLIGRSETTRREPVVLLDELCWKCKDRHDDKGSCDQCNGVGYITTDAGDALLAFLDRHRA